MGNIDVIDSNNFVTIQGVYGVLNKSSSYTILNINTQETVAQNISSFLDCVKTIEYLIDSNNRDAVRQESSNIPLQPVQAFQCKLPSFGFKSDVQALIEKYAPSTVRVQKKVHRNQSRYKCYNSNGQCIGRVMGREGDRYWQDLQKNRFY